MITKLLSSPNVSFKARLPNLSAIKKQCREKSVAILGSAKDIPGNKDQRIVAEKVAHQLAKLNYDIFTGGGPGIMQAANTGAHKANPNHSWAILVSRFKDKTEEMGIYNVFGKRKDFGPERTADFMRTCDHSVVFPGGTGTGEELWSLLETKAQKRKKEDLCTNNILLVDDNNFFKNHLQALSGIEKNKFGSSPDKSKKITDIVDRINIDHDRLEETAEKIVNQIKRNTKKQQNSSLVKKEHID